MDRLFDESFVRPFGSPMLTRGYGVALDVQTEKDEYVLRANVPGLKPEDLHVEVVDNTVTIRGEIKEESKTEQDNFLLQERRYGQFSRSVTLPTPLDPGKAEATIENGVLVLRLPKAEEAKPKMITVKARK
ncbi:MAG: molecular chaperone (small heat shock protein) [Anaerolineales bacterium]|jgi:HSP20 family protein|nr:molecular chaperone (small heat shock protein) [Anaerolineales bacterium]